jgi:hypothetical protein
MSILANPIVTDPLPAILLAWLLEACMAALLLARRGYPAARALLWWAGLSLATFGGVLVPWRLLVAEGGPGLHVIEIPIVLAEALLGFWLLRWIRPKLSPVPSPIGLPLCLQISLVVNAASYLASLAPIG